MDKKEKDLALREAKILEILDNQFIISFKDVFKTKAGKLCIVMDYAEKGDFDR
jgi:NIMA (never in mitosis gene a)-related kinase